MSFLNFSPLSKALLCSILLLLMIVPIFADYLQTDPDPRQIAGSDISHIWRDGKEIAFGLNPYSSIHGSDMRQNMKYSTYLPGFFLLEVVLVKLGISNFEQFFPIWRLFVTLLYCAIGLLIFFMVKSRSASAILALFSAFFWLLGRWSFGTLRIWQIDFVAIALLLLSFAALAPRKQLSYFLLGCSLAIKQVAVFALPLFIIYEIKEKKAKALNIKSSLLSLSWIFAVPLLTSLPFLYMDFSGFVLSIVFSLTRNPGGLKMESIDQVLNIVGLPAKIPLLFGLLLVYWLYWKNKFSLAQAILLSFLCFVTFNSVVFKQYLPWSSAFLGLALSDIVVANCLCRKVLDKG